MNDRSKRTFDRFSEMPSILDREINDRHSDAFGHQDYAVALRHLIEAPTNKPPFSIGLLGPWGTGKSSIKELYRRDLESDKTGAVGKRRADRIHVITFNAWRFGGEQDLKRSLLREAFKQLGGDEVALRRALYDQVNKITHERRKLKDWLGESFGQIIVASIILLLLFLASIIITSSFVFITGLTSQYSISGLFVAATVLTGMLGRTVVDLRLRSPAYFLPQTSVSFPATSAEEYERLLTDQIAKFRCGVGRQCERLVIFVDDLDRLSAPEMVNGLDAIRSFLELPFNTPKDGFGVVFVISCDEDKIAEAIKRRGPDLPGAVFSRGDARRYLDRLFQYRLEIPQFPKMDMRRFALKKLQTIESLESELKKIDVTLDDVIDRLIHVDVHSPRNAIQILNAFIQSWWIGSLREHNGVGSSAPGALHTGAVTHHPLSLAALSVLRVDFPDFYDVVQSRPEIIQEFRKVVIDGRSPSELPPQAQHLLSKFLATDKEGGLTGEARSEHRRLRRYLASLADLRWPTALQPLLRLAEDPITRKFGDRAPAAFDSLVSGDATGVLEAFGRRLDDRPLAEDDVTLLESFGDVIWEETPVRRTNAARVLAELLNRIPQERRRRILSPLVRQMAALKTVRTNIQPDRARRIVKDASTADRRDVAEKFIGDLLHSEPLDWRLATGGEPNLDEVVSAVKDAVELALEVKTNDGLSAAADDMLRRWLLRREVRLGNESRTLPFSDLERWVERYSDKLLEYLAADYSDQAIGEFERTKTEPSFTADVLPKLSVIFSEMAEQGEDEREVLWSQLIRLVAVQPQAAAEAAWDDAARHSGLPAAGERREFLIAFAERLSKEIEDGENWPLDGRRGAESFDDLAAEWRADIDMETAKNLEKLVLLWAADASREQFALRALDVLKGQAQQSWQRIISALSQRELSIHPQGVSHYLGSNFDAIDPPVRNQIIVKMDAFINTNESDENAISAYNTLVKSMPDASWSEQPLKDHLSRLLDRVNAMHNNPVYLDRILPVAAVLFKFVSDGKLGPALDSLLANAAGTPNAYITVHRRMKDVWPKPSQEAGDYKPDHVIVRGCQFIQNQSGNPDIGDVYESVCSIARRGFSSEASDRVIADVTPIVWRKSPGVVAELSTFIARILKPAHVAEILTGGQAQYLEPSQISGLLAATSKVFDKNARHQAARQILALPPVPLFERSDGAFEWWVLAGAQNDPEFVTDLLVDDELNDEQRNRVLARASDETLLHTSPLVETLLKDTSRPKTRAALIERLAEIVRTQPSASGGSRLAQNLISSLPSLSGDDLYSIAKCIDELGGMKALERHDEIVEMLDHNQIKTLAKVFPTSRPLRRKSN